MYFCKPVKKYTRVYLWKKLMCLVLVIGTVTVHCIMDQRSLDDCHYLNEGDSLPSTDDLNFFPRPNSIFFHETSCEGDLTPRQACAVEAAARSHPEKEVYVLFSAPVGKLSFKKSSLNKLLILKNVRFARVHIIKYAQGTPLEKMIASRPFRKSKWWMEHTSDVLRYLTLYKYGGVYLDTDMYVVKNLAPLGQNWVAKEDINLVNGAIIAISKDNIGRNFINTLLSLVSGAYISDDLLHDHRDRIIGPDTFSQVLKKMCTTDNSSLWSAETCGGLEVYSSDYCYPVPYMFGHEYFTKNQRGIEYINSYTHHLWDKLTNNLTVQVDSPFAIMSPKFCPMTYQTYGMEFGLAVYEQEYFYPVNEMFHAEYMKTGPLYDGLVTENTYAHHLWNRFTYNMTVERDSPFSRIVPLYCPTIYQMSGEDFGY